MMRAFCRRFQLLAALVKLDKVAADPAAPRPDALNMSLAAANMNFEEHTCALNMNYTQIHKYTNTQIHKYTNIQIQKYTGGWDQCKYT